MDITRLPPYVQKKIQLRQAAHSLGKVAASTEFTVDDAIKCLYDILTTLDAKASALMQLNGVMIAASTFFLGGIQIGSTSTLALNSNDAKLMILCAFFSAFSIFCCLFVVGVSWPFLGNVSLSQKVKFDIELKKLGTESDRRRRLYRFAWALSLIASIGFVAEFGRQTIHVFKQTF